MEEDGRGRAGLLLVLLVMTVVAAEVGRRAEEEGEEERDSFEVDVSWKRKLREEDDDRPFVVLLVSVLLPA